MRITVAIPGYSEKPLFKKQSCSVAVISFSTTHDTTALAHILMTENQNYCQELMTFVITLLL